MDGVIVNSEPLHKKLEIETCSRFGIGVPDKEWDSSRGKKVEDVFSWASRNYGTGKEPIEEMVKHKVALYLKYALTEMELVPGAREFLIYLKNGTSYRIALTTSGKKSLQDQILKKFELENFFEIIVTSEDVKKGKPDPEPYAITVKKLREDSQSCLVIEDADNGIISAKAANCIACGITTTFSEEKLKMAGADIVVNTFLELKGKL